MDTARAELAERQERIRSGRDLEFDLEIEAYKRLWDAELSLAWDPTEHLAVLERYWTGLQRVEELERVRLEAGITGISKADFTEARARRLWAEYQLASARAALVQRLVRTSPAATLVFDNPLDGHAVVRRVRSTALAEPGALKAQALQALFESLLVRWERIRSGRELDCYTTMPIFMQRLEIARAMLNEPAELLPYLEAHWQTMWTYECVTGVRVEAGVKGYSLKDLWMSVANRLQAEIRLCECQTARGQIRPLVGSLQDPFVSAEDPLNTKSLARAKFQFTQARLEDLRAAQRNAIEMAHAIRFERVRSGQELDVWSLCDALDQFLETCQPTPAGTSGQRAALIRALTLLHLGERVIEVRIEAGVLGYNLTALYMIRYYRLLAQRKLVELSSRESNQ
jgi:hypothetical protein